MKLFIRSLAVSLVLLLLCGVIYPLFMTAISSLAFPKQSVGSMLEYKGKPVGSELLGQAFSDARFFHGRVSSVNYNTYKASDTVPDKNGQTTYKGLNSGSSNLAPSNPALVDRVNRDIGEFLKSNPTIRKEDIPTDLLTCSGSGLDPHLSPNAARIQIPAISTATGISVSDLQSIVDNNTEGRMLWIFGEPRVNILKVNLEIAKKLGI